MCRHFPQRSRRPICERGVCGLEAPTSGMRKKHQKSQTPPRITGQVSRQFKARLSWVCSLFDFLLLPICVQLLVRGTEATMAVMNAQGICYIMLRAISV